MINLVGYDDFGKEIRFNLSQVKDLDYRRCSMTILADEYEVIDPETVRCLDCEEIDNLREQVKVLRESKKQMLDEIRQSLKGLILVQGKGLPLGYPCDWVDAILAEQEAKL